MYNLLFVLKRKYSKDLKEIELEGKDERGQIIAGKSALYTLVLAMVLGLIIFGFSVLKGYEILSTIIAVSYVMTALFNLVINSYLDKTN